MGHIATSIWIVCYFLVLLGLSAYGIHRYTMIYLYWKHRRSRPEPASRFKELPRITIQLPIFNELYVVRRLIGAVSRIDYPRELLQIQILDDSTDETTEICREEEAKLLDDGFDVEYIHRVDRIGFKAGALEHGMESATGEYIYILDADFVPEPNVLHEMIHFFTDIKVGMIQTRWGHINKKYSILTRIQALFLDGHLAVEQTARSRSGRFFNFNGTAGIWRKDCIIDAGGWEHDTLTEDLDLSYRAQMKGWKFVYLKDVVTPAELPPDMNGFKSQQHRWAKGSIQTCLKILGPVWRSKLPRIIKLEATAHLTSNFAYLLLILLCVLVNPAMHPESGWVRTFVLDIPIFFATTISVGLFYVTAQIAINPSPLRWLREICYLPVLLALGIGMSVNNGKAVFEALLGKQSDFVRTPKYGIEQKRKDVRKAKYRALKSLKSLKSVVTFFEVAFFLYFSYLVLYALALGNWIGIPFLILFQAGFFFVAYGSLRHLLPGWVLGAAENDDAVLEA
jgi:cellulose synthase/poly-beta-1,6-N-acetylglucosamine synthase-like glycosyltransferase